MTRTELYEHFETEFNNMWNEYADLHKKLDDFRGKKLQETDIPVVNKILSDMQDLFHLLYPFLNFTVQRYQFCARAIQDYNSFIEQIKGAGAEGIKEAIS